MATEPPLEIVWAPQPGPQKALVDCPVPEVFFGGARGGGKTDGVLGKYAIKGETYGKNFNAIFFRRELPSADDAIERSQSIFAPIGWKYNAQRYTWRTPHGGRLRFRPLERVTDAEKYQGQNITDVCVEEAGNYPDPKPIDRMNGVLRSAAGVPVQLILTGNPGGPGQQWIKKRYVDPAPRGFKILTRPLPSGRDHRYVFIPSRLQNNRVLMHNDPSYIDRLHLVGSDELVKAWLDGDWSAIEGAYFDCWSNERHVIAPFTIPEYWLRFRSFDWGSARPFSVGWWASASEDHPIEDRVIPKGAIIRYREWYGAKEPNVGLKLDAEEVARGIVLRTDEKITYSVADPSIFAQDGGPSLAERMAKAVPNRDGSSKLMFRPADNKRVAGQGHIGGWDALRHRLIGMDGKPMIYTFSTCTDSIRTIPALQHDVHRPEDVDTNGEDHAADEWRYACMSRPWMRPAPEKERGVDTSLPTLNELWKIHDEQEAGW